MLKLYENKYLTLGIVGALIILFGRSQAYPQALYVIGSVALLITAIHYKLLYFIALELILMAGHSAILLGSGPYIQFALPLLLCVQLLFFYLMTGKENPLFLILGISGIALLSMGFAYDNQWIFFSGSLLIAVYAYYLGYTKHHISYIWAVLNTVFAVAALYNVIF
ncbi:MAG: hypothetical protein ACRC0B_04030 [Legionella sp.]